MKKIIIVISVLIALALSISCAALPTNNPEILAPIIGEWVEKPFDDGFKLVFTEDTFAFKAPEGKSSSLHGTLMNGTYGYIPSSRTLVIKVDKALDENYRLIELPKGVEMEWKMNIVIHPEKPIAIMGGYEGGDPETLLGKWVEKDERTIVSEDRLYTYTFRISGYTFEFKKDKLVLTYYNSKISNRKDAKVFEEAKWGLAQGKKGFFFVEANSKNKRLISGMYRYMTIDDCIQISFPYEKNSIAGPPIYYEKEE